MIRNKNFKIKPSVNLHLCHSVNFVHNSDRELCSGHFRGIFRAEYKNQLIFQNIFTVNSVPFRQYQPA